MKTTLMAPLLGLATLLLSACEPAPSSQEASTSTQDSTQVKALSESARLNTWFDEQYEEELQFSPIELTFQGSKDRYSELDDFSLESARQQIEWKLASAGTLKQTFDYEALDPETQLSYDLWLYQADEAKRSLAFLEHDYLFNQMWSAHSFLPTFLINFHKVDSEADMQAYIARIRATGVAIDQLRERAKAAAEKGIRPPRFAYEFVIKETRDLISNQPFTDSENSMALWEDAQTKINTLKSEGLVDESSATQLTADAKSALLEDFLPAYQKLLGYLENDMEFADEQARGVSALPNGLAYYSYQLQQMTTTDLTVDQIHEFGLEEVARLRAELEAVKDSTGFEGSLDAFFTLLRDDKDDTRFYYPDTDAGRQAYIDDATAAIENIKGVLPEYFGLLPQADLVVKRVEAFREQDGAAQHYYPGTPDGSRPGIYYAHLSDMTSMPKNQLEVIAYHEGLPGHHMQISIAQELQGIPHFRRQAGFTAYAEGWALYSEKLAKEMPGTYQDPYSDFGRLTSEIWRAIRLVLDTGLHAKGWSEEEAVTFFAANSPEPMASIRSEVQRYLVLPGQATSYKIGMTEIQRLRAEAEATLKEQFDIRAFHDAVLGGGALPLTLLERRVEQWVSRELATIDQESL